MTSFLPYLLPYLPAAEGAVRHPRVVRQQFQPLGQVVDVGAPVHDRLLPRRRAAPPQRLPVLAVQADCHVHGMAATLLTGGCGRMCSPRLIELVMQIAYAHAAHPLQLMGVGHQREQPVDTKARGRGGQRRHGGRRQRKELAYLVRGVTWAEDRGVSRGHIRWGVGSSRVDGV